jgi:tetratricopeptide (TPR) repeat protein
MTDNDHIHPAVKQRMARERAKAVKAAEDAVASARASYGEEHPQVATALANLGKLHQGHSDFGQAEAAFKQALTIREKRTSDAAALVAALRDLARLHDTAGQGEKARPLMQRAARVESEAFRTDVEPVESAEPEYDAHAEFVENMAGSAPKTFWTQTLGGLLLPAFLALRGATILASGRMVIYLRGALSRMVVEGAAAHMAGLVWLCAAAFAHFHFFWPYRNRTLCSYGKAVSFVMGILLLFAVLTKLWTG